MKKPGRSVSPSDEPSAASVEDRVTTAPLQGREKKGVTTQPVLDDRRTGGDDDETESLGRGAAVGRYDILRHLASGGMGAVYTAYDPQLDRRVALKVLTERGDSKTSRERLQLRLMREAQAMARLTHPNVVAVHDVGTFQGRVFLAMEFVDGVNLRQWLAQEKRRWQDVRDLFVQAGRGLAAAHAVGLIHRDFKPDNVLIGKDGRARVADFGLARPTQESLSGPQASLARTLNPSAPNAKPLLDRPITQKGVILGTPRYMAPEQIRDERTDERTDQFSFAVAFYDALYGVRPFAPKDIDERLAAIDQGKIQQPPPGHGVPDWMGQAVRRALAANPDQRWPTMDAFLEALQRDSLRGRANFRVAAALLVAGALAAGAAFALRPEQRCTGGARALAGSWDDGRKDAVRRAFAAQPDGEAQFTRTAHVLDDYAQKWAAMRDDTCAATRIRGEQSESVMQLKMGCLDLRLHELQYLTTLFTTADAKLVERGVDAAGGLSSVRSCADATALTQEVPPPEDPAARKAIQALKERLSEAKALRDAGLFKDALEKATADLKEARALRYKPVEAEAALLEGILFDKTGQHPHAVESLNAAVLAAEAGRADTLKVRAATEAVFATSMVRDFARGKDWAALAQAILDRLGGQAEAQGDLLVNLGALHFLEGQHALAATMLEQARQLLSTELGPDDPRTLNAAGNLAAVYAKLGRLDDASRLLEEAMASMRRRLGPDHALLVPRLYTLTQVHIQRRDYASAHKNIDETLRIARARMGADTVNVANALDIKGTIYQEEGRYQEALATYQQALAIKLRILPADNQILSYSYDGIGQSLLGLGKLKEARAPLERALAIRGTDPVDLADTQFALARTIWQPSGQQKAAAIRYGEQARRDYQRAAKQDRVAVVEAWLAKHH
ncbi:MAG TPA: tetratricopeptide repeat protein [Myxococcaceae bacterium]|nr:tetratricopeptide repeat protein [Myxococcaceae bacterium]